MDYTTLVAVTAENTIFLEKLCKEIMELDPKIRFVGIISEMGKMLAGGERPGIKLLIDNSRHEMLFMAGNTIFGVGNVFGVATGA